MSNDYYNILGVDKSASADEIKRAYRKLALKHHPDRAQNGSSGEDQKFKELNEAYQVLSNPEKRRQYDQFGHAFDQNGAAGGQGFGGGGFEGFDFSGFGGSFGGFGDIFEEFFGAQFSQVQAELSITPAQATLGDHLKLKVDRETVEFDIPPGTQNGASFRFPGKGKTYRGNKKGDLILTVKVETPKHLTREQRELWQRLKDQDHESKRSGWFGF